MRDAAVGHMLVSVGALSALFALLAVFDQSWELVYLWLGIGLLAQAWECLLPAHAHALTFAIDAPPDGLPDRSISMSVVTFLHSVFVPVVAMLHAGFLDGVAGVIVAILILLAAQYRLAYSSWAANRHSFMGFPSSWGVLVFYFHAFDATAVAAILMIGLGMILGLLPIAWPHPLRSERWPTLTRAVTAVWLIAAAATLWLGLPATALAKTIFLAAAAYGLALAVLMAREQTPSAGPQV